MLEKTTIRDLVKTHPELWHYNYKWRNTENPDTEKNLEEVLGELGYSLANKSDREFVGEYNDLKSYLDCEIVPQ